MTKFKKLISYILIISILLPLLPVGQITVHAYDEDKYSISEVILYKIYDKNRQSIGRVLTINGKFLKDADVSMITNTGNVVLTNRQTNTETTLQFILATDQVGSKIKVGSTEIDLNEGSMPTLTQVSPEVKSGYEGELTLKGTNFSEIDGYNITAKIYKEGATQDISNDFSAGSEEATINNITLPLGLQDIVFERNTEQYKTFNDANQNVQVKVKVTYTYKDQFLLYQEIAVDNLQMTPNRGSKGETIFLESPVTGTTVDLREYDIFFLSAIDGTDSYKVSNRGKNRTFQSKVVKDGKEYNILTAQIPDIPVGEYFVVLTNIANGTDPGKQITQRKVLDQKFTVIDGTKKPFIQSVLPASGPDTGSNTTISGKFLGTMNIDEFTLDDPTVKPTISGIGANPEVLTINYGAGTYGTLKEEVTATREIKVTIGGVATFLKKGTAWDVDFNPALDKLTVRTSQVTIGDNSPIKDVVVETTTTFTKSNGEKIIVRERAEKKGSYRYILSTIQPEIVSITPEKIQVIPKDLEYEIPEDRMFAIYGKNFMLHKYRDDSGAEIYRYPRIQIGDIVIDKDTNPDAYIRIFSDKGAELDGTENNDIGIKILVMLPKGAKVSKATKEAVSVQNPVRNSMTLGLTDIKPDFVEFVVPESGTIPVINTVKPDTVSIDGGETVTITGNSFQGDVQVIIDGEVVKGVKRKEDGTEITFPAPKGREGETQIQVMNPSGGMDTRPFFYVKTFTNPKIIDFNPKKGNSGTIVMIKGENFLRPDPMGTEENVFRLIGTRVFLDDLELNEYNRNPQNNRIQLVDYQPDAPIFEIKDKKIDVKPYYQGILLKDVNNKKYILTVSTKGEILLSDGGLNNYDITIASNDESKIIANKQGGLVHTVNVADNHITLRASDGTELELSYITPYKVNNTEIVGQKVKVIDGETIYFTVPIMNNHPEGYKDLTIINPDTKKDAKTGNAGFFFVKQPERRPEIYDVIPKEGSVAGGYAIEIIGKNFETNTATKPKVYINAVEVPAADTTVNIEGTRITVIVPKYVGDLKKDKNTDRWPVPVVVLNPDGGTANDEKGFFYVIPSSSPQITKISPVKGSAAGAEIVEIWGKDFRYFEPYDDLNGDLYYEVGETFNDLYINDIWDDLRDLGIKDWDKKAGLTKFEPAHPKFDHYYNSPILPKIYFGNKEAQIVEFNLGYIKVLVPAHAPGKVDVFLLNNDGGISAKTPYTYEATKVAITDVVPDKGRKEGGDKVEVHGTGFAPTNVYVYKDNNIAYPQTMPLIRLGNISNRNIDREKDNSGLINNQKATVELLGGLKVEYNGHYKTLAFTIEEGGIEYKRTITNYDNKERYLPMELLKSGTSNYSGKELVRIAIEDGRLLVDRGYAPKTTFVNNTHVSIETPSYYTVGKTPIFIINPDGGTGSGDFEYKNPDSKPVITNITRDSRQPIEEFRKEINGNARVLKVNYKGGSIITVEGTDFRDKAIIKVSNLLTIGEAAIEYDLPTKLTFTMPALPESQVGKLLPVVVQNTDGGSALSDKLNPPIFIEITKGESDPETTTITPAKGSAAGSTKVVITGSDFRETMKGYEGEKLRVYFGEVEATEITKITHNSIELLTPASTRLGKVSIRVENPDGTMTSGNISFEYISKPAIQTVSPNKLFTNDTETEVTLTGTMFQDGAKVIVGATIVDKKHITAEMLLNGEGIIGVDANNVNREVGVVGGVEAATIIVENDKVIKVTFPETNDLANSSLIIINPDGGVSDPYDNFSYEIPVPTRPLVLEGIPGYESTVQLIWSKSAESVLNRATSFEIYGRLTKEKENNFIGSTTEAEFLVRGLETETEYTFMVRALNKYGAAIDFATVTVKTLDIRQDKKLKEKEEKRKEAENKLKENGNEETINGRLNITLGTSIFKNGAGALDLSLAKYRNQNKITVLVPIELARKDNRLTIKDGTMTTVINVRDMYTLSVSKADKGDKDAYLRIHIDITTGTHLPRGTKAASKAYELSFDYIYGKNTLSINELLRPGKLFLEQDTIVYPNTKSSSIYIINEEIQEYQKLNSTTVEIKGRSKLILLSNR
ncbi:IPT/TIG domain-containing protein [Tissierella sp.]|uniref:IPT/TIG domain-containing protein n=1 Tax=Tissierella sp. TaxID=41274 RepID=UPI0028553C37|nr:IPT/TIG domain-containing protein [Tissierella sp.]MDR7857558.1 IPT/TIG domain-containing protein [Tissierella sp.]